MVEDCSQLLEVQDQWAALKVNQGVALSWIVSMPKQNVKEQARCGSRAAIVWHRSSVKKLKHLRASLTTLTSSACTAGGPRNARRGSQDISVLSSLTRDPGLQLLSVYEAWESCRTTRRTKKVQKNIQNLTV